MGYKVQVATNPVAALEDMRNTASRYDLIITDYLMPQINGIDFTKAVRELEKEQNRHPVPVIVISGDVKASFRSEAF